MSRFLGDFSTIGAQDETVFFLDGHLPIQSLSWQWPYAQSASSSQTTTMSPCKSFSRKKKNSIYFFINSAADINPYFLALESNMPELLTKPILTEAMSMPLLQHPSVSLGNFRRK